MHSRATHMIGPIFHKVNIRSVLLNLLRQSTVSAPIGFISEAVDNHFETSATKKEMLQQSCLSCFCVGSRVLKLLPVSYR